MIGGKWSSIDNWEAGRRLIIVPKCEVLSSYDTIGHRGVIA